MTECSYLGELPLYMLKRLAILADLARSLEENSYAADLKGTVP